MKQEFTLEVMDLQAHSLGREVSLLEAASLRQVWEPVTTQMGQAVTLQMERETFELEKSQLEELVQGKSAGEDLLVQPSLVGEMSQSDNPGRWFPLEGEMVREAAEWKALMRDI